MRFVSSLARLLLFRSRRTSSRRPSAKVIRPLRLEALEERIALTVTFQDGPLIPNVQVQTLFDGTAWNDGGTNFAQTGTLNQFSSWIVNSPYMDMLSNAGYNVGRGSFTPGPIAPTDLSSGITHDSDLQTLIQSNIDSGKLSSPNSSTLYMVYVQPGVEVIDADGGSSAVDFYGYHSGFAGHDHNGAPISVRYAVLPYQDGKNAPPAAGFTSILDGLTEVASHELAESVTDPDAWNNTIGWYDDKLNEEIADIENQKAMRLDGWAVQDVAAQNDASLDPVPGWATLTTAGALALSGSGAGDTFTIGTSEFGGMSINRNGEEVDFRPDDVTSVSLNTGAGTNIVNVQATQPHAALTIVDGGTDTVNVGNGGSVQSIKSPLNIQNASSLTTLNVDDSADSTGRTATLSSSGINGLSPAAITFSGVPGLTVKGGTGSNSFSVTGTPSTTTLIDGGGSDTVSVSSIRGIVFLQGQAGDVASLDGSNSGNNVFTQTSTVSSVQGNGYFNQATGFQSVVGTSNSPSDISIPSTFVQIANPINNQPSFTARNPPAVNEDSGANTVPGWVTSFNPGSANESSQSVVAYHISAISNPSLFTATGQPAIDTSGTLTYTLAPHGSGTTTFAVTVQDNGGTANGGMDTSAPQTFTLTVNFVNHAPSFLKGSDQTILEDAGPKTVANWATSISAGPANESGQTILFQVTGDTNPSLFSTAPAISAAGTLTFTPAANANGKATITLVAKDNGGTANGGVDTGTSQTFVINVTPVNDAPSFLKGSDQSVLQNAGQRTITKWATNITAGPANEASQTVAFQVTGDTNPSLFSAAPAISPTGTLTFTPALNALGNATITVVAKDNGGTANGGIDTSVPQTFIITLKRNATVQVMSTLPSSVGGQAVTFTANVGPLSGTGNPTGVVTFKDGNITLGTGTLSTVGGVISANFTTTNLTPGIHAITAVYGGDTIFGAGTSPPLIQVVTAFTTTTVASTVAAPAVGQAVTFVSWVNSTSPGTPTGTINFYDNGTFLGTGTLSTTAGVTSARFTTSTLMVGSHNITTVYTSANGFTGSTSPTLLQKVNGV